MGKISIGEARTALVWDQEQSKVTGEIQASDLALELAGRMVKAERYDVEDFVFVAGRGRPETLSPMDERLRMLASLKAGTIVAFSGHKKPDILHIGVTGVDNPLKLSVKNNSLLDERAVDPERTFEARVLLDGSIDRVSTGPSSRVAYPMNKEPHSIDVFTRIMQSRQPGELLKQRSIYIGIDEIRDKINDHEKRPSAEIDLVINALALIPLMRQDGSELS